MMLLSLLVRSSMIALMLRSSRSMFTNCVKALKRK